MQAIRSHALHSPPPHLHVHAKLQGAPPRRLARRQLQGCALGCLQKLLRRHHLVDQPHCQRSL